MCGGPAEAFIVGSILSAVGTAASTSVSSSNAKKRAYAQEQAATKRQQAADRIAAMKEEKKAATDASIRNRELKESQNRRSMEDI